MPTRRSSIQAENNYITLAMVRKALSTIDGKLTVDFSIVRPISVRDFNKILRSFQARYQKGLSLELIADKLHFLFNWRQFEYQPLIESKEKYLFLKKVTEKMNPHDRKTISYAEGMIRAYTND